MASYLGDVSGLQKVLEHHKVDCKVQKDVLHEAMKIIYDYQQVVTSLVKQKHILEKVSPSLAPISPLMSKVEITTHDNHMWILRRDEY